MEINLFITISIEMKLSEAFSQSLLNLTLQDQIAGSNSSTSTNESEANEESYDRYLSKEKRGRLWKFLQLKQVGIFDVIITLFTNTLCRLTVLSLHR